MSAHRNLSVLNKLHRTNENHLTEVVRLGEENVRKYRQVNYEAMRDAIDVQKRTGNKALERVTKLQNETHAVRQKADLKIARECWLDEERKLKEKLDKNEEENRSWLRDAFQHPDFVSIFHEIMPFAIRLDETGDEFRKTTLLPIVQLKEELKSKSFPAERIPLVIEALDEVKQNQTQLIEILDQQEKQIDEELKNFEEYLNEQDDSFSVEQGIPEQIVELPCPDNELRATILQEFFIIDHKYRENLVDLDTQYLPIVSVENGGWNLDEHKLLSHLYEIYPVQMKKRRTFIYEHFHRHFPQFSRQEMLNHEEWMNAANFYQKHKRLIYFEWKQARAAMELKAQSIFQEAFEIRERIAQEKQEKSKQRALCEQLANQVQKWREKQFEILQIRQKLEESRRQAELEKIQEENERLSKQRQQTKEKIAEFYKEKSEKRRTEQETEQRRLEEMQKHLNEQKRKDWERIKFRREEFEKKRNEFREKTEAEQREQIEREERLQLLADTVRPHHIDFDHARVLQPTKAFNAHRGLLTTENDDINIQQSLFPINTFNDRKLVADIRIRLEQRLRDAGLIQTDYARQALAAIQRPPKRSDTQSNQNWSGFAFKPMDIDHEHFSKPVKPDFVSHPVFYGADN